MTGAGVYCLIGTVRNMIHNKALDAGSLRALAREWKVSPAYLSDIQHGRRNPGPKVLKHLGLTASVERTVTYRHRVTP